MAARFLFEQNAAQQNQPSQPLQIQGPVEVATKSLKIAPHARTLGGRSKKTHQELIKSRHLHGRLVAATQNDTDVMRICICERPSVFVNIDGVKCDN